MTDQYTFRKIVKIIPFIALLLFLFSTGGFSASAEFTVSVNVVFKDGSIMFYMGSNAGLAVGDEYTIYSGDQELANITLTQVDDSYSIAKVVSSKGRIKEGENYAFKSTGEEEASVGGKTSTVESAHAEEPPKEIDRVNHRVHRKAEAAKEKYLNSVKLSVYSRNVGNSSGSTPLYKMSDEQIPKLKPIFEDYPYDIVAFQELQSLPQKQAEKILGNNYDLKCANYECIALNKSRFDEISEVTKMISSVIDGHPFSAFCKPDAVPIFVTAHDKFRDLTMLIVNVHLNSPGLLGSYTCQTQQFTDIFYLLINNIGIGHFAPGKMNTLIVGDFNIDMEMPIQISTTKQGTSVPTIEKLALKSYPERFGFEFRSYGIITNIGKKFDYALSNFDDIYPCYEDRSYIGDLSRLLFDHPGISCRYPQNIGD
jgi:hypothetical protein